MCWGRQMCRLVFSFKAIANLHPWPCLMDQQSVHWGCVAWIFKQSLGRLSTTISSKWLQMGAHLCLVRKLHNSSVSLHKQRRLQLKPELFCGPWNDTGRLHQQVSKGLQRTSWAVPKKYSPVCLSKRAAVAHVDAEISYSHKRPPGKGTRATGKTRRYRSHKRAIRVDVNFSSHTQAEWRSSSMYWPKRIEQGTTEGSTPSTHGWGTRGRSRKCQSIQ